jgi:hypothetical protein
MWNLSGLPSLIPIPLSTTSSSFPESHLGGNSILLRLPWDAIHEETHIGRKHRPSDGEGGIPEALFQKPTQLEGIRGRPAAAYGLNKTEGSGARACLAEENPRVKI